MGRSYSFTLWTRCLGLAAAIGTGNVGLLFDVWHWYTSHATFDDVRKLGKDDVVYVHVNDAPAGIERDDQQDLVRCLPGETGVIPVPELLQILKQIGYDGPVVPEPLSEKGSMGWSLRRQPTPRRGHWIRCGNWRDLSKPDSRSVKVYDCQFVFRLSSRK